MKLATFRRKKSALTRTNRAPAGCLVPEHLLMILFWSILHDCGRLVWALMSIHDPQKRFTGEQPGFNQRVTLRQSSGRAVRSFENLHSGG